MRNSSRYSHNQPSGIWDSRHELCFNNSTHVNNRSYFDRQRDFPDTRGANAPVPIADAGLNMTPKSKSIAKIAARRGSRAPPQTRGIARLEAPTISRMSGTRKKTTEAEKLRVSWTLLEPGDGGVDPHGLWPTLRRCESDPATTKGVKQRKRRAAWFSGHDVAF
jgi:hypothetical protein